jgi:hypothetical protein
MKVMSSTSFVHEGPEGRVYHFSFPGSFPLQEGYAVCHAICQELEKKMQEMVKAESSAMTDKESESSPEAQQES